MSFEADYEAEERRARTRLLVLCIVAIALLAIGTLPAQVVRLHNHSASPYDGWTRVVVDSQPPFAAGTQNDATYVVSHQVGASSFAVDVRCDVPAGGGVELNLARFQMATPAQPALPVDLLGHFGGPITIGGQVAELISLRRRGAAWEVCARTRLGKMLCAHLWLRWYPSRPATCQGEFLLVASNPAVQDMGETTPDVNIGFGDAVVIIPGRGVNVPVVPQGTYLADGQGRSAVLTLLWIRHATRASDWSSVGAATSLGVGAVGVRSLTSTGGPLMPLDFSGRQWAASRFGEAVRRLHTWDPPVCGPATISGSAGEQEDSLLHPGGEALTLDGVGAEWVRYLSAIKLFSERPCNHLEADSTWLEPARHPSLVFWDGRAHWHTGVSPDRLGKPRVLTADEAHGRWGPDVQHFYCRTLTSAAMLRDSPLCQQLLRNLCVVYLLQRTANPTWATSQWESAREWGCEGQFVVDVHLALEDRAMAARVVARWRERVERVLLPRMAGKDLLMVWDRDPRVNPDGLGAQWWQESFASWSIDEACRVVGPASGRELALRVARRVLDVAWREVELSGLDEAIVRFADPELQAIHEAIVPVVGVEDAAGTRWRAQPQGPIDGSANAQNPSTDSFNHYGMPLCVATVLRADPANAKAQAVWTQLMGARGDKARRWMPKL